MPKNKIQKSLKKLALTLSFALVLLAAMFIFSPASQAAEFEMDGYAWSENIGWVHFKGVNYGVTINTNSGILSGYAWSEHLGWLSFDSNDLGGCPSGLCEARFNKNNGRLTGWAKFLAAEDSDGSWDGWVKLDGAPNNANKVTLNQDTGEFEGWAWGDKVVGWISFNCKNQNNCSQSNYKVTTDYINPPDVSAISSQCGRVELTITDNSEGEDEFRIYRDTDSDFDNGSTYIDNIVSGTPSSTGTTYQYIDVLEGDEISGSSQAFYYHATARRAGGVESGPGTSEQVTVNECPPNLTATDIYITQVTRDGATFDYTGGTRIRDGDLLTMDIVIRNTEAGIAENLRTNTDFSANLEFDRSYGTQLSTDGSSFNNVSHNYSSNTLLVPAGGNLGDISDDTWVLRYKTAVNSESSGDTFDRFSMSGVLTYTYDGDQYQVPYSTGQVLIYLGSSGPTQFREDLPNQ